MLQVEIFEPMILTEWPMISVVLVPQEWFIIGVNDVRQRIVHFDSNDDTVLQKII